MEDRLTVRVRAQIRARLFRRARLLDAIARRLCTDLRDQPPPWALARLEARVPLQPPPALLPRELWSPVPAPDRGPAAVAHRAAALARPGMCVYPPAPKRPGM